MTSPVEPRPAATVLLVRDDPFSVLMVRRSAGGPFPDAMVFPGGTVDASDRDPAWLPLLTGADALTEEDRATRIAAIRETFEEVGIFLAIDRDGRAIAPAACDRSDFRALVAESGGRLALDTLAPLARWITPERASRRYDTHFLLARMPDGQVAICDDVETLEPQWMALREAEEVMAQHGRAFLFPTRLNILRLAESRSVEEAFAAARARPVFTVLPWFERRADGDYSVISAEAGYAITEGLHASPIRPPAA